MHWLPVALDSYSENDSEQPTEAKQPLNRMNEAKEIKAPHQGSILEPGERQVALQTQ
jgi:hypothetical protein